MKRRENSKKKIKGIWRAHACTKALKSKGHSHKHQKGWQGNKKIEKKKSSEKEPLPPQAAKLQKNNAKCKCHAIKRRSACHEDKIGTWEQSEEHQDRYTQQHGHDRDLAGRVRSGSGRRERKERKDRNKPKRPLLEVKYANDRSCESQTDQRGRNGSSP
ncbi:hypothetical protein PIB30_047751 [Stylosanthes scabra]|uniref:Uncharacterized protein n=1 Tax=Stylosanthes scabra TaxID=79078 RepID=A0ABU6ZFK4_9FABA|nr:hypothetical protein [Stylosanthes scabra]